MDDSFEGNSPNKSQKKTKLSSSQSATQLNAMATETHSVNTAHDHEKAHSATKIKVMQAEMQALQIQIETLSNDLRSTTENLNEQVRSYTF